MLIELLEANLVNIPVAESIEVLVLHIVYNLQLKYGEI